METENIPVEAQPLGVGGFVADKRRYRSDARLMRRLIRNPVYVPNEVFRESVGEMWGIVKDKTVDPRARVAGQKAINEIMKLNLAAHESIEGKKEQAQQQHLHLHQHNETTIHESLTLTEIARITSTLGTPEVVAACLESVTVDSPEPAPVESVEQPS